MTLLAEPFVQRALLAAVVTAVCAGAVGVLVVLRAQAFAVHAVAELAFTGAAAALLLGIDPALGMLVAAVLTGGLLGVVTEAETRPDAAIGSLLAIGLGLGVLLLSLQRGYASAATSLLLGSVLAVSPRQLALLLVGTAVVLTVVAVLWRPLLFSSVDPAAAAARGVRTRLLAVLLMMGIGVASAQAVQVVGVLLVVTLVVTPAATAVRLAHRPATLVATSVGLAVAAAVLGVLASLVWPVPATFCVATLSGSGYLLVRLGQGLAGRRRPAGSPPRELAPAAAG